MGWFDDLLAPPPQAQGSRRRNGWFDDIFGGPGGSQEPEGPEEWVREGIFEVNSRTGARRLANNVPGGLPTADIDRVIPDLPQPGAGFDLGAFGKVAGTEAVGGVPRLAGLVDTASEWLGRPDQEPESLGGAALEGVRRGLRWSPLGAGLIAGKKVRDVAGVTDALGTANEALDALEEQEREKLRRGADTPLGSVATDWGAMATGMLADPTNLIGGRALVKGGRALAEAAPEGSIRRYLLQDLAGGADSRGATLAADEALPALGSRGRGPSGLRDEALPGEPSVRGVGGEAILEGAAPGARAAGEAAATRSVRTGFGDEVPLPEVAYRGEARSAGAPWVGAEGARSHIAGEHWSASRDVAQRYAEGYGELGRLREEALPIERPFSVARRYTYEDARKFGPEVAQRAARESGAKALDDPVEGMAIHKALADDYLEANKLDRKNVEQMMTALRRAHERIVDEGGFDSIHHVHGGADAWAILRREGKAGPKSLADEVAAARATLPEAAAPRGPIAATDLLPDDAPEIVGRESVAYLSTGKPVPYRWVLRDADTLEASHLDDFTPNPRYPHGAGAQPRDLSDAAEQLKIQRIRAEYNPDRVGPSSGVADEGAGFFARTTTGRPFMMVGNSRTIAQRQALEDPAKLAGQVEALARQNREFGFPEDFLEQARAAGIRKPVAVREVVGDFDPVELGRVGNTRAAAALSERDVARSDATQISNDLLGSFVEGASIDSASNRDFVRGFLAEVVPPVEHGPFFSPTGELTTSGARRIRNALFASAYDDPDAIARLVDSEAEGIKNVGRGMADQAARLARIERGAVDGSGHPVAIGKDVAAAARKLAELRDKRMPVEMYLRNGEMFSRELTDESRRLLEAFEQTKRDRGAVGGILRRYAELVEGLGDPRQGGLLGPVEVPSKAELLDEAIRTWKQSEAPLLFDGGPSALVAGIADALPGPLGAVARHLDPAKALRFARRWLTNWGDQAALGKIAPEVAEKIRLSVAGRAAHEARAAMHLRDYDAALKAFQRDLAEGGIQRTEDEIAEEVLAGITGKGDLSGLSPELQRVAGEMRAHVDELTGGILENQPLTKELRYTLDQNLGEYLRRTYEIHRDAPGWEKVVKETEPWRWQNVKRWVGEQHPQWTDEQIEGYLNTYFQRQPEAATAIAPRSDVFRVEKGLFKHRIRQHLVHIEGEATRSYPSKEAATAAAADLRGLGKRVTVVEEEGLPKELEDFLGLHVDPRARYSESVARMAHDLSTARLMGEIRQMGEGAIFHREPLGQFAAEIPGDPAFNPLAKLYTTPEIRSVLQAMGRPNEAPAWLQKLYAANAAVRIGKTVHAPKTHIRNFLSWNGMLLANGHFTTMLNVPRVWKAAKIVSAPRLAMQGRTLRAVEGMADAIETVAGKKLASVFRFDVPALRTEFERAMRLGVVGEGARSGDFARYLGLVSETKVAKKFGETAVGQVVGKVGGVARELYMAEDDVGKLIAWLAERANYQWAFPELSVDEIAEMTAKLTRDLYPTYSKAAPAVRAVRDFPFIGDFPTFWAEIIRTSKNTLKQGASELAQARTNPRLALVGAKRLAGFGTAIAAASAIGYSQRARLGISSEEVEAAKEFAPEWNRHSDLVPVEKKGPGQYSVLDVSYINPYAMFSEAWNALTANGYQWDDRIEMAFGELLAPFLNEGIVAGTAIDLARNRTDDGRAVYPDFGTRDEKAAAMAKHVASRLQPGFVSETQEAYYGATGDVNPRTGRTVDVEKLAYSYLTGTRLFELDVPKRLVGSAHGLQRARGEIVGTFNRLKKKALGPTPELLEAKVSANAQWRRALADFRRKVAAARATGLSDYQIRKLLNDAEIGKQTIDAVMGDQDFEVAR